MTAENQLSLPVLEALDRSLLGELTTSELRMEVRATIRLTSHDLRPLRNRNDQCIDQIVRNIKSHKDVAGNLVCEGYLEDVPRGFRITDRGRALLKRKRRT